MSPDLVTTIGKETIIVILLIASPILFCGMAVGLVVSVFQAVTQIQEMTLTFVPKIIVVMAAILAFAPWMLRIYIEYTTELIKSIPIYIR
jgi:flagellar biosynthetic protein FliQ